MNRNEERAWQWAKRHGWCISNMELMYFIRTHETARAKGDTDSMEYIEAILTECNFHSYCSALCKGNYARARTCIKKTMQHGQGGKHYEKA